jgi:SAM-dependent methyltransferase
MSSTRSDGEKRVQSCYSTWSGSYYESYYGANAPYPPVHRDLIRDLLRARQPRTLLDAGCGPASFLREVTADGMDLYGFDLTPEMVAEAQRVLAATGTPPQHLWQGSVLDSESFRVPAGGGPDRFDAVVCAGVMPHVTPDSDAVVIRNLRDSVRPGGLVILEARNQLFSLFTLNRYTHEFFARELLTAVPGAATTAVGNLVEQATGELAGMLRMDLPPVRRGTPSEPGYDEVLSRTHNPHVLQRQFIDAGLEDVEVLFFHFHALPPMFESRAPELFRELSLGIENPRDWRGYYMASAFLLAGIRSETAA